MLIVHLNDVVDENAGKQFLSSIWFIVLTFILRLDDNVHINTPLNMLKYFDEKI